VSAAIIISFKHHTVSNALRMSESEVQYDVSGSAVVAAVPWVFYIIENKGCTYAGVSPDPVRRLRQHNSEIKGGAIYTTSKGPGWRHVCLVKGFKEKQQALQFEWAVKHVPPRSSGGLAQRLRKLYVVLNRAQWTSKAVDATTVPLVVEWHHVDMALVKTLPALPSYVSTTST
jgi:predicted GIY-YIG superfamily endonuclease